MRSKFGCFIFLMIMMTSQIFAGTVYYVDATNGDDSKSGTSEANAWKTIAKVNGSSFNSGDSILFMRGEIWRERLTVPSSGSDGSVITFGAYGSGNDPIISGSEEVIGVSGDWTNEGSNVWSRSLITECFGVTFDSTNYGVRDATPDAQYEWNWASNELFVYSVGNPTGYYSSIEAGQRNNCVSLSSKNYITIDGIRLTMSNDNNFNATNSDNWTVQNSTIDYAQDFGVYWSSSSNDITIDNCDISYNGRTGITWSDGSSSHVIKNSIISYNGQDTTDQYASAIMARGNNTDIYGNTVHHNCQSSIMNKGHGIYLGQGTTSSNVYQNTCYSNLRGNGIYTKGDMNIYQNISYDNYYIGIAVAENASTAITVSVYYNICYGNYYGFAEMDKGSGDLTLSLYNNTFYENTNTDYSSSPCEIRVSDNLTSLTIKNNIVNGHTSTSDYEMNLRASQSSANIDNNCYRYDKFYYDGASRTWSYWTETLGFDTNGMNSDPLFIDASSEDFRLTWNSPCIDAGIYVGLTEDYAGNTVPYGWGFDIGAYEYTGISPLYAEINASPTSGEIPLTVNFTGNAFGGTPPYSYSWNFGDGTSSSEQDPSHIYSQAGDYTVYLTITDGENTQDNDSLIINVFVLTSPLEASFIASPTSGEVPLTVNFTGSATGGVLPYSYSWDFGDSTSSSEQNPTHTCSNPGDYTVILIVTDSQSSQDTDSLIINAYAPVTPLEASFIASPTSGEVPLTVNFTGSATGGVLPYGYSWDFGDGTSSSEQNPSHTYSEAGDYTAYLTVTDSESNEDNDSLIINASAAIPAYLSCSPKSLFFGATTSGNKTTDQYLRIINAGGGTLTWNIEDDADWLSCTPSSGTDRGEITVSVNASGLSLGLYIATITVSSPEAYNSPQYVSVNFRVYEPDQENPPFGSLDTPVDGSTVSGSIPVTGWALDDIEVVRLEIKRNSDPVDLPEAIGSDGLVYVGDAVFVEGARPDVEKSYPDYPLNSRAGWGYMLLTNDLPYRGNGSFTLYTFAYDAGGHREEIGRKTILCDNINRVKPFGTIDTPEQGEIIRGSDYVIFGWALTPLPKTIPKDGSTITVWVDGVQVGHPVYDQYREDIATLYPEYNNAQGAVGYYYIDTTLYENGIHTIAWSVMDDEGEVDEIGARYFFIDNVETASIHNGSFGLRSIYREDVEGRLRIGIKEIRREYRSRVDDDRKIDTKSILKIQIEEMEPLRIVLEESSSGNMEYIGWGENEWKALPIGSTLDREKGTFSWIPTPGFIGRYVLHFAVTDGSYMSEPLRVEVNVIPKNYALRLNKENWQATAVGVKDNISCPSL